MKTQSVQTLLRRAALALFAAGLSFGFAPSLDAVDFVGSNGWSAVKLFETDPNHSISSVCADDSGNVIYLEQGDFGEGTELRLLKRSSADNYGAAEILYDFDAALYGSATRVDGLTAYFADGNLYEFRTVPVAGGSASAPTTVNGIYDIKISGGSVWVSAYNFNTLSNRISVLNLGTGVLDTVLDTAPDALNSGDYSGPLTLDALGGLYYGSTAFGSTGDLYYLTPEQVAAQIDSDPLSTDNFLRLSDAAAKAVGGSQYLETLPDGRLLLGVSPFGGNATLTALDLAADTSLLIGATLNGEFFGGMQFANGKLFLAASDFSQSAVFAVVPEPTAFLTLVVATISIGARRKRQRAA